MWSKPFGWLSCVARTEYLCSGTLLFKIWSMGQVNITWVFVGHADWQASPRPTASKSALQAPQGIQRHCGKWSQPSPPESYPAHSGSHSMTAALDPIEGSQWPNVTCTVPLIWDPPHQPGLGSTKAHKQFLFRIEALTTPVQAFLMLCPYTASLLDWPWLIATT